uniref:DDE Tnp4 domain-containing protein n=1 Tax=Oryzias latipes TaxID=8090 RepID=A0A3P9IVQ1_ORYLA
MFHSKECGIHFPDGQPTRENPYPVLFMGYDCRVSRSLSRLLNQWKQMWMLEIWKICLCKHVMLEFSGQITWTTTTVSAAVTSRKDCGTQTDPTPSVSAKNLNNKDFIFYTGLCADSFWLLLRAILTFCSQPLNTKLAVHEQFLLVLMRLRLGLLFTDLGKRFGVSRTTASEMFTFWRPILARFMREKVIVWLPRDTLNRIRTKTFNKNYPKATCIIHCTEVFVQKWFCSSPIPGDKILADRGFTVKDILPPGVSLALPAFTRGRKELSEHKETSTRRLANVRIHIERAIRRLKGFKILCHVISGKLQSVDEISICAGLCNMQPLLIRNSTE